MRSAPAAPRLAACIVLAALALLPARPAARAWQGVSPGQSSGADVEARFGPPSTRGKAGGRTALVYKDDAAMSGTKQAQFYLAPDGSVAEIVVFPAAQLDAEAVEGTYGKPARRAFTEDFKNVWIYPGLGVTVFFGPDGAVEAFSFKAPERAGSPPRGSPGITPQAEPGPQRPAGGR